MACGHWFFDSSCADCQRDREVAAEKEHRDTVEREAAEQTRILKRIEDRERAKEAKLRREERASKRAASRRAIENGDPYEPGLFAATVTAYRTSTAFRNAFWILVALIGVLWIDGWFARWMFIIGVFMLALPVAWWAVRRARSRHMK